jgi:hypothetical protein
MIDPSHSLTQISNERSCATNDQIPVLIKLLNPMIELFNPMIEPLNPILNEALNPMIDPPQSDD